MCPPTAGRDEPKRVNSLDELMVVLTRPAAQATLGPLLFYVIVVYSSINRQNFVLTLRQNFVLAWDFLAG